MAKFVKFLLKDKIRVINLDQVTHIDEGKDTNSSVQVNLADGQTITFNREEYSTTIGREIESEIERQSNRE